MLHLCLVITALLLLGLSVVHLRHQRLELRHQMSRTHDQLLQTQRTLWRQQLDIATYTSPKVTDRLK